jgi:hypothetical protein
VLACSRRRLARKSHSPEQPQPHDPIPINCKATPGAFRSKSIGNGWPGVENEPYEENYLLVVVFATCTEFKVQPPQITQMPDGFVGRQVRAVQDIWTCSVAADCEVIRDRIVDILSDVEI